VIGVEPERSNAVSLALDQDEIVTIQPQSVADGLGAPFAGRWTLAMTRRHLDGIVLLDDPTILAGLRFALERMKQVVEPAGSAALAAVLAGRVEVRDGERVAVVISGGNVEVGRLGELIAAAGNLPGGGTAA
jgi:threonine dehydratase